MSEAVFNDIVVLNQGKYDFLIDHAIRDVWCNPEQDNQHIINPYKITPPLGVTNSFQVMLRTMALPSKGERYHIYQVGQLHPLVVGLFEITPDWQREQWLSLSDVMSQQKMIVDVYGDSGIQLPRFETFYCYTNNRDLLIAVKEDKNIPFDYVEGEVYLRVYSNAYFKQWRVNGSAEGTFCQGAVVKNTAQILGIQQAFEAYKTMSGLVYGFVNGYLVDRIDLFTVGIGDTVEFVYDATVVRTVTFTVGDLAVFNSILDVKRKYLLHYASDEVGQIDYQDDIDIFVLDETLPGRYHGVYYHKNSLDACRMVTHRDYSIAAPYVVHFAEQLQLLAGDRVIDIGALKIQLNIRKAGYNRPLVFENNRIQELYKLPESNILPAMVGSNATVPVWQAANLEQSAYTQIMRSKASEVTQDLVEAAYGYNAVSKLLGDTPKLTYLSSGRQQVEVPHGLSYKSTAYEYDASGKLLGFYTHDAGTVYNTINASTRLVEMLSGMGDYTPDVRFGTNNIPVPTADGYRVYRCHKTAGGIDNQWVDVTGTSVYTVTGGKIVWSPTDYNAYVMVRTDAKFLAYDLHMFPVDGSLRFSLSEMETQNGTTANHVMPVPMGELTLFLNGNALIQGLDYIVRFPEVVIINKRFLSRPFNAAAQWIHVRFTGFCQRDLTLQSAGEVGWVKYGLLSKNSRFDIRDDRVLRIVMNGSVYDRSQLVFSETHSGLGITNARNGYPYQIRDIVVPMKNAVKAETYAYREASRSIDQSVGAYLSTLLPEAPESGPSAIHQRYDVFSPFISKLLYDLTQGILPDSAVADLQSDNDVLTVCKPYEGWLVFDPIRSENAVDPNYVIIHPNNDYSAIPLNLYQYRFLRKVVDLYCNGLVELSPFVTLTAAS